MSSDVHVSSTRLRAPSTLSARSTAHVQRRQMLRSSFAASTSSLMQTGPDMHQLLSANRAVTSSGPFDGHVVEHHLDSNSLQAAQQQHNHANPMAPSEEGALWLDVDRFEDWEKPTLDVLCPDIRIEAEDLLFPVAIAEDGETLPSDLHPSYPYGDLHAPSAIPHAHFTKPMQGRWKRKRASLQDGELATVDGDVLQREPDEENEAIRDLLGQDGVTEHDEDGMITSIDDEETRDVPETTQGRDLPLSQASHTVRPNSLNWPFRRYGLGPGGSSALLRHELRRPWRPYRSVWSEIDLTSSSLPSLSSTRNVKSPLAASHRKNDQ